MNAQSQYQLLKNYQQKDPKIAAQLAHYSTWSGQPTPSGTNPNGGVGNPSLPPPPPGFPPAPGLSQPPTTNGATRDLQQHALGPPPGVGLPLNPTLHPQQQQQQQPPNQTQNSNGQNINPIPPSYTGLPDPDQQQQIQQQQQAAPTNHVAQTPAQQVLVSPADRWGLLGLLAMIKSQDPDQSLLAVGTDLGTMGLDMGLQGYIASLLLMFIAHYSS